MANKILKQGYEILGKRLGYDFNTEKEIKKQKLEINNLLDFYIEKILIKVGEINPPVNPENLYSHFGVTTIKKTQWHTNASLISTKNGFEIIINSTANNIQQRSALAHELGHTLFYNFTSDVPLKSSQKIEYWEEEGMAYNIARKILIPTFLIKKEIRNIKPSLAMFEELVRTFDVSHEFMMRRLSDFSDWNAIILKIDRENNNEKEKTYKLKTIVKPRWYNKTTKLAIGKYIQPNTDFYEIIDQIFNQNDSKIIATKVDSTFLDANVTQIELKKLKSQPSIIVLIHLIERDTKQLLLDA